MHEKLDEQRLYTTRIYLNKLSCGINPLDDTDIPEDSFINTLELSRAFSFGADVLSQLMERGCELPPPITKMKIYPFEISEEERTNIVVSEEPVGISIICKRIAAVLPPRTKNLGVNTITSWLLSLGLLEIEDSDDGRKNKVATKDGSLIGITNQSAFSSDGREYTKVLYNKEAQALIIDNLEVIEEFRKANYSK